MNQKLFLRLGGRLLTLYCLGHMGEKFFYDKGLGSFLYFYGGLDYANSMLLNWIYMGFIGLLALCLFIYPTILSFFVLTVIIVVDTFAEIYVGGKFAIEWTMGAYGARIFFPLAFIFLYPQFRRKGPFNGEGLFELFLALGTSLTFFFHGLEAWVGHPSYVDFLISFFESTLRLSLSESMGIKLLKIIGVIDISLAFLLLSFKFNWVIIYMISWGLLTAAYRLFYFGIWDGTIEFLLRTANWASPLVLLFLKVQDISFRRYAQEIKSS